MEIFESDKEIVTTLKKALSEIDENWRSYKGLIIPGSHTPYKVEQKIGYIKWARETGIPFLGICFGYQLAAIEYARNVLRVRNATSEEFGKGTFVVKKRKELNIGLKNGESYWHNYDVVIDCRFPKHFITCQFHPEYQSSKDKPHPLLTEFIQLCRNAGGRKV